MLGPIRDPRQVIGGVSADVARHTGLRAGIPVVAGLADHVSSAFAAGLAEHGDLLVKLGGSVDVLACSDRPLLDARLYLDAHPSPGLWLPNGCMASGGSGVRWFQRELAAGAGARRPRRRGRRDAAGRRAASSCCPTCWARRRRSTIRSRRARSSGLSAAHGRGHVFRAVLESFAYGVRHHLEVLAEHGVRPTRARVTNGGASSLLWKQIVADVTGLVLEPVVDHPGSALGAAYAAGMGTAAFAEWSEIGRFVALGEPILPRTATAAVYDARYRAYRELYGAAQGSVNVKHAPPPGASATRIVPPWSSTIARAIASPRPVPPAARLSSPRQKRSNTRSPAPGGSPLPVSATLTSTPGRALITTRPPGGVWRMALPTRFASTRPSWSGSQRPRNPGGQSRSSCTRAARASAA